MGSSKLFKRLGIALTGMALAIGVGVGLSQRGEYKEARAGVSDISFEAGVEKGSNGSSGTADTLTKAGVTLYGTSFATTTDEYRLYSGADLTISVTSGKFTEITFTSTANKGSKYGPDLIDVKDGSLGSYATTADSAVGTWTNSTTGATSVVFHASAQARFSSIVVTYDDGVAFGTLSSIELSQNSSHKAVFNLNEEFSSSGLVLTATDTESHTKSVTSGFTCSGYDTSVSGKQTVTVSLTEGGETAVTTYSIIVLTAEPLYNVASSSWSEWADSGTYVEHRVYGESTYAWRMSESELYSTKRLLGNYSNDCCAWNNFSAYGYYSSIAAAITQNSYAFAMYSQNFVINKPTKIQFSWTAFSGGGSTNTAYILYSDDGGYSWNKLTSAAANNGGKTIVWSGDALYSKNNVLIAFAYTSSNKSSSIDSISITAYGDSLTKKNAWSVQKVTISGSDNVEAEQNITLTASTTHENYETPANTNVNWSSETESVATVAAGVVTGVSVGSSVITASAADGYGAQVTKTVSVTAKLKRLGTISLNTENVTKSFVRNSAFNYTGLVVTANYANGFDSETVNPTSVTAPDMTTAGNNKTVTVTYSINGTQASSTYTINVTPIVSENITIEGSGATLVNGRYEVTVGPNNMYALTVTCDGDEAEISSSPSNANIYYDSGYLCVESTESESGTITFTVGNATAYLDVTVDADEAVSYVTPVNGEVSCIQHQTVDFEFLLINAIEGSWTEPTNSAYTIVGTGDETGYAGAITINDVCEDLEAVFSVETSKGTLNISLFLTATADSITGISIGTMPTKTTYIVGESFNASGLVISASRASGVACNLASNEYRLTDVPATFSVRGTNTIHVELVADDSKTTSFNVTVNMPSGLKIVTKTSNDDQEFEGTQITNGNTLSNNLQVTIGNGDENNDTLIGTWSSGNNILQVKEGVSVEDGVYSFSNKVCVYTLKTGSSANTWRLMDSKGNYIYAAGGKNNNNYLKAVAPANITTEPVDWTIEITNEGNAVITCADNTVVRNTIRYNSNNKMYSCYASDGQADVYLYSVTMTHEETFSYSEIALTETIYDFIRAVYNNSDYYTCNNSGTGSILTNWSDISSDATFTALTETDKTYLSKAVAANPGETMHSAQMVVDFLSQYDYVVGKYGVGYDYLGRVAAGTITVRQLANDYSFNFLYDSANNTMVAVIAVVSAVSLLTIGGYFFIRRRKER